MLSLVEKPAAETSAGEHCYASFVKFQIRVPEYLPKVLVRILKITRVATPKGIVSILYDHRSCRSSLLHNCIDFLFGRHVMSKREFCRTRRSHRGAGILGDALT